MRAGLYLRISDDRTGREAGVTRQGEDCTAFAEQLGAEVVDRYVDNDLSASTGAPRPAYERLLADVKTGHIDTVIAWHPDRLYRRVVDLEALATLVEQYRLTIRTVRAGEVDLTTPSGRLAARNMANINAYFVEHNAENWKRSVVANRRAGKWSNSRDRLYGYERDGRINPDEADRLRWIAQQVLAGRSLMSIANELNDQGATTSRGNRWGGHALRYLLLNPRIAGYATHKGEIELDDEGARIRGSWKQVLNPELWERVTAALHPYKARGARQAVLTRLVWCAGVMPDGSVCGTMMHSAARYAGTKRPTIRIYRCPSAPPYNVGCGRHTIAAEPLELYVETAAKRRFDDPRFVNEVEARRTDTGRLAEARRVRDELEGRLGELSAELSNVKGRTATAITAAMAETEVRLDQARDRVRLLYPPEIPDLSEGWPVDVESRNTLISLAINRVWVSPNPPPGGRGFNPDRVRIDPVTVD